MDTILKWIEQSGLTLQEIGERMGFPPTSAKQRLYAFKRTRRPTILMLQKFAKASGVDVGDLIRGVMPPLPANVPPSRRGRPKKDAAKTKRSVK